MADVEVPEEALRTAWRQLVVRLVALRGDAKFDAFIEEKHGELKDLLLAAGDHPPTALADDAVQKWFLRKLRKSKGKTKDQISLCKKLTEKIQSREAGWRVAEVSRLEEALRENHAEEGPLVCAAWAKELEGSRFEGLWICREKPGVYRLGDARLRVAAQVLDGKLLVHGYFEGDMLHPVRIGIKPFLAEHGPKDMRAATDEALDLFGNSGKKRPAADRSKSPKKPRTLPAGWEKRASRSKPGVFYYVNEAKGLSQLTRPTADD